MHLPYKNNSIDFFNNRFVVVQITIQIIKGFY